MNPYAPPSTDEPRRPRYGPSKVSIYSEYLCFVLLALTTIASLCIIAACVTVVSRAGFGEYYHRAVALVVLSVFGAYLVPFGLFVVVASISYLIKRRKA